MKIRSVEAELFHAEDGRTDGQTCMTKPQAEAHEVRSLTFNSLCQWYKKRGRIISVRSVNRIDVISVKVILFGKGTSPQVQGSMCLTTRSPVRRRRPWHNSNSCLNKGRPTRWHLLYYLLLQPALGYHITNRQSRYITPARLKSAYSSGSAYTRIPHHQQTIPLHNTSTPQVSLQ